MNATNILEKINMPKFPKNYFVTEGGISRIPWKRLAATLIARISKCFDKTEPGQYFALIISLLVSLATTLMPPIADITTPFPSVIALAFGFLFRWTWLTLFCWAILYTCWEICQGMKWLGQWAERNKNEK